ncbi:MAG: D-2-hydroxyacid dehydrogenase [Sciscionella sp.]|nr:D-2-hydroxyacid dehydrogenase [Sciscionella sp.]
MANTRPDRPVVAVLYNENRPPIAPTIDSLATVRYTRAQDLTTALVGADALFVWDFHSSVVREAWPAADRLDWVHTASAGVDKLMFPELRSSSVVLTNSRGVFEDAIAESVLAFVLAFAKDLPATIRNQSDNRWQHRESERIAGRVAAVVGTGPIGRASARLLRAAGMRVFGIGRRRIDDDEDFGAVYATEEMLDRIADVDYVVAVAPLTEQTRAMFDATVFAAMKSTARFINVGRGELTVTKDLVAAIDRGEIAGAALDVFETEPLPNSSPLWSMPNVIVSPHMTGDVAGWQDELVSVFVDNFSRWRDGRPLRNVVDKRRGYVPTNSPMNPPSG